MIYSFYDPPGLPRIYRCHLFYLSQLKESGHFQGYLYIENGRQLATFYLAKKKKSPEFWIRGLGLKTFSLIQVEEMETSPDFAAKYAHHLQRARERQTKYYYENADSRRDYAKDYYQRNKELRLQQAKERYQLKKALAAAAAITSEEE